VKQTLRRTGISLPEVIGVFAMLVVLSTAITPHLRQVREASRLSKLRFNLQKLRKRIDDYRNRNGGHPPAELEDAFEDSPTEIPENPFSNSYAGMRNRTKKIDSDAPLPRQVTASGFGGWLYNPRTGGIWADHGQFLYE
jgi:type II secretory pathway pseudopilin PulG